MAKTNEELMCPRRMEAPMLSERFPGGDLWRSDGTCSWCGSMKPEDVFAAIERGEELEPSDKDYKLYIRGGPGGGKFYFQHFSTEDQERFIALVNAKRLNLAYPGRFYRLPFFMCVAPPPGGSP